MLKPTAFRPTYIFITAFNQFAIEAIKHSAFDYLLKPVDRDELRASISRYKEEAGSNVALERIETLLQALQEDKIMFSSRTGNLYLKPDDIAYCKADGNYTTLFLATKKEQTVTINLGRLIKILPSAQFAKISRSLIINKRYLSEINRKERTCILLVKDESIILNISPRYISRLTIH
jgi:two-component system LytT family response regulator